MKIERPDRPNFEEVNGRFEWTDPRVAYVRHLAEVEGMTAREIADDIGLDEKNHAYPVETHSHKNLLDVEGHHELPKV